MNREIVVGFVKEHEDACLHTALSQSLRAKDACGFCHTMNMDSLLLITRIHEARKTVDVGIALSSKSKPEPYTPYHTAGFHFFHQTNASESENIRTVLKEAFDMGYESVILMGHGTPNIPLEYLENALEELRRGKEIVLGPTLNGRFYLIGIKKSLYERLMDANLFNDINFNIRKGRDRVIRKIRETCSNCNVLPEWYAIKSIEDLRRLCDDSLKGQGWKARWTTCLGNDIILTEEL